MSSRIDDAPPTDKLRTVALRMGVGALVGAAGAGVGFTLARRVEADAFAGPWSYPLGVFLGFVLLVTGLLVVVAAFSPRAAALVAPGLAGMSDPGTGRMSFVRVQGIVMALAGAALMLPPLAASIGLSPDASAAAYAAVLGVIAVQTWFNIRLWRRSDEMLRRVTVEAGAASFWIFQGALFLWAAAEVLGFAPALTSWDLMTLLMLLYLAAAVYVGAKRGLG